ncbi:MAG TPA: adenylyltransferase/cytidyltransferase family protein [Bacilli bacterium]|nr:adenylyltransferase/cytidyltransferase family protein [Bacilli bacterium]
MENKKSVLVVGRFSGFHRGHVDLIKSAVKKFPDHLIIVGIVTGKLSSKNLEKNPFSFKEKKLAVEKILKNLNIEPIILDLQTAYIPEIVEILRSDYNIDLEYVYCGSDRLNSYTAQGLEKLGVKVISVDRDETSTSDLTKSASATKLRNAVKSNNFDEFKNLMPDELDIDVIEDVWRLLRIGMQEKNIEIANTVLSGITHIEDLDVNEFIEWVKNFYDDNIVAIQKLDGTFNMSVGKDEEGIYLARLSKGQSEPFSSEDLPKIPIYNALRGACLVFERENIVSLLEEKLEIGDALDIEVLYGQQPNTIRYNLDKNYLAFLRFIRGKSGDEAEKILDDIYETFKEIETVVKNDVYYFSWETEKIEVKVSEEKWKFTKPQILNKLEYKVDTEKDLKILEKWLSAPNEIVNSLSNFECLNILLTPIPKNERELYKKARQSALEKAKELKLNIKNKMIEGILDKIYFELGGSEQEGLVLRNKTTKAMTKLVDKEKFTRENQKNWYYIEKAIEDGVVSEFFALNAEQFNIPMLKLREKFFKQIRQSELNYREAIEDYIEKNNIPLNSIEDKIILIKNTIPTYINKLKSIYNEAKNDTHLSESFKLRTSNTIGILILNFSSLFSSISKLNIKILESDKLLTEYILLLIKTFSSKEVE